MSKCAANSTKMMMGKKDFELKIHVRKSLKSVS